MLLTEKRLKSMIYEQMAINEVRQILNSKTLKERERIDENMLKMLLFKAFLGLGLNKAEANEYTEAAMQNPDTIEQVQNADEVWQIDSTLTNFMKEKGGSSEEGSISHSKQTQKGTGKSINDQAMEFSEGPINVSYENTKISDTGSEQEIIVTNSETGETWSFSRSDTGTSTDNATFKDANGTVHGAEALNMMKKNLKEIPSGIRAKINQQLTQNK